MHTLPSWSTAITPPRPPSSNSLWWITLLAASSRQAPENYMMAEISQATTPRMKNSPSPVDDTAQVLLLAQHPAPIMGESPILPYFLFDMPPVEVAAATFPVVSNATAPTVPSFASDCPALCEVMPGADGFMINSSWPRIHLFYYFANSNQLYRRSVQKQLGQTIYRPCSAANWLAPSPDSITCWHFSITFLAAEIGFFIRVVPATDPAFLVFPSIMLASISLVPSAVKTEPLPALKSSESSMTLTAASTASKDVPLALSTASPTESAYSNLSRKACSSSGVMNYFFNMAQPPCMAREYLLLSMSIMSYYYWQAQVQPSTQHIQMKVILRSVQWVLLFIFYFMDSKIQSTVPSELTSITRWLARNQSTTGMV